MSVTIEGVSKRQKRLLNIMWNIDSSEDYEEWKSGLSEELMNEVDTLETLLMYESIEEELQSFQDAKNVLSKFAL
jgi:hypothetical protein